jgi:hypothetical protein
MTLDPIVAYLSSIIIYQIPIYLVWLVGIILACTTQKRNPKTSLYTLLAIASLIVMNLAGICIGMMPLVLRDRGYAMFRISMITNGAHALLSILSAGGWGLLLAAIFIERKPSASVEDVPVP